MVKIESEWKGMLLEEFNQPYMQSLREFLVSEKEKGKTIYPAGNHLFNAFNYTPFTKVKVVILGQDPYHGPGQAHGLCFSVPPGVRIPPSLMNIYKEMADDLKISPPTHGNLTSWAEQGILLLNTVLSVEHTKAGSHQGKGWEKFTDKVIEVLNSFRENLVFLLWGRPAQEKGRHIDSQKHLILKAPHPSPLSAHRGFLGCKHFSKTNAYLEKHGIAPIHWDLKR